MFAPFQRGRVGGLEGCVLSDGSDSVEEPDSGGVHLPIGTEED